MHKLLFFITFASFAVLLGCQPAAEQTTEEAPEQTTEEAPAEESMETSVEAGQQAIIDAFEVAWNAWDAAAVAALYTADADSSGPDGEMYSGREEIAKRYAMLFETIYAGTTVSIDTTSVRELNEGVVLVNGSFEVSGMAAGEGEEMPAQKGLYTNIIVKEGDQWLITSLRSWFPVEAPGTT